MFNIAQVIGNGTTQTLFTFDEFYEGSIHSLHLNNTSGEDKAVTIIVGSISFSFSITANTETTKEFKINIPNSTTVIVNAPTGVTVTASYIKQVVDTSVALTEAQELISNLPEGVINDTTASTVNTYSSTKINTELATRLPKVNPVIEGSVTEEVYTLSGTDIDPDNGTIQVKTLSADTTFTESLSSGQSVLLRLVNGSSYTITFPTTNWVSTKGNVAPTLTANDVLVFWKEGASLYGAYVGSGVTV